VGSDPWTIEYGGNGPNEPRDRRAIDRWHGDRRDVHDYGSARLIRSDIMQFFTAAQANTMVADLVAKASGSPIVAGTVNIYLMAKTGVNAGKWFQTSDDSWQAAEAIAGAGTHQGDGHWACSIDVAAWTAGVRYSLYAKESGDLHIPYSEEVAESTTTSETNITVETTVIQ
jgi:hypothetical protein